MSDTPKKFYLTTPIYYVNARPHIGHAYTTIVADVLARRNRLLGPRAEQSTFFLTGTDEHGQKIERSAAAAGIDPQAFTDQVSAQFRSLWDRMGLTYDRFIRTTDPAHKRGAQKLFAELYARDQIYLSTYTGSYCVSDEAFVDAPVGTPCPDCGRLLEEVTEENFFFKLSEYQLPLLNLIESNELLITPESSRNEVLTFLRGRPEETFRAFMETQPGKTEDELQANDAIAWGKKNGRVASSAKQFYFPGALRDLSVSRSSFTWGIPVPEPAASASTQSHVIYVWLDALSNYMTAIGYGSEDPAEQAEFQKYWPANLHLVGKEITRFHCVYWPAFLLAAGLPLPKQITAHGWLLFDNSKMSKSKGNIVRTETILAAFGTLCPPPAPPAEQTVKGTASAVPSDAPALKGTGFSPSVESPTTNGALAPEGVSAEPTPHDRDLFASDVLRYFLLREIPFGQDGSFSFDALITRYNADLANGYGNLVSRTLAMIAKYYNGVIPRPQFDPGNAIAVAPDGFDEGLLGRSGTALQARIEALPATDFAAILTEVAAFITIVDGFISSSAPWKLAKDPAQAPRLATVLYLSAEAIRWVTGILHPYCPFITARVWAQLGLGNICDASRDGELAHMYWGGLKPETNLGPLGPIFPRAPKELAQIMIDMETPTPAAATTETSAAPQSSNTSQLTAEQKTSATSAPNAPPRAIDAASSTLTVGGSSALTSGPDATPSHTAAQASGIFAAQPAAAPEAPAADTNTSPQIAIDDFVKIDLRVAQIVVAERIPKADKLLRLEVDLGYEKRQILSGIAEFYTPEDLIGRRIVIIANLAPRKMRGLESHGMLLAASEGDHGKPILATMAEDIALGSRLK
jgi:methionyl-tRNA synthetase